MSIVKLKSVIKENKPYPINGVTTKPYKNNNHLNLNDSFRKNEFEYNIWLSEKQCESLGITLIDKLNPSYTISRWGVKNEIFNISQTDFFKPKRKKSVSKPKVVKSLPSDEIRIEMLERMVINLYNELGYSMSDVDTKDLL